MTRGMSIPGRVDIFRIGPRISRAKPPLLVYMLASDQSLAREDQQRQEQRGDGLLTQIARPVVKSDGSKNTGGSRSRLFGILRNFGPSRGPLDFSTFRGRCLRELEMLFI